jgi:hypothetical protein
MIATTASIFADFWNDQIKEHNREGIFLVLLSFELSFLFIRTSARMSRSVSWWPGSVVTDSGVHLHHLVWGICLLMVAGTLSYTLRFESPWWELTAVAFGIGAGLTLDEFALWVYLRDVYWAEQGRKSLDAVAIATVFMALLLVGLRPFEFDQGPAIGVGLSFVVLLTLCVISFLKERIVYGMLGLFVPIAAVVGAFRLGKPGSPWAKWRYNGRNPGKQRRSQQRFDDARRRANRFKQWLFDLIGGRPTDEIEARELQKRAAGAHEAQQEAIGEVRRRAEQSSES